VEESAYVVFLQGRGRKSYQLEDVQVKNHSWERQYPLFLCFNHNSLAWCVTTGTEEDMNCHSIQNPPECSSLWNAIMQVW